MTGVANLQPDSAVIVACTISRDVQNFEMLIDDMEVELGERWGDLSFDDALGFLEQPEADALEFVAIAVDTKDEPDLARVTDIIRTARARNIKVVLIANQISPLVLHQLLRLGAEDFVPYPLPAGALHEAIERLRKPAPPPQATAGPPFSASAAAAPHARPTITASGDRDGVVLPVHGMAGGVGASTFATNLAWEIANCDPAKAVRVCLIDLDFQFGSVATYLDLSRKEAVFDILSDTVSADRDSFLHSLQTFDDRLHVFTAPPDMVPLDIVQPDDIARIIAMAKANFDFVVIDLPTTVVSWTETVLTQAHLYFALLELDLRSAQNVVRMMRALKGEELPYEKLRFVLNRAPKFTNLGARSRAKRMAESLDIEIEVYLPDGGGPVTQANDHGLPLAENAGKNPLRKEIAKLAKSLFDLNKAVESGKI